MALQKVAAEAATRRRYSIILERETRQSWDCFSDWRRDHTLIKKIYSVQTMRAALADTAEIVHFSTMQSNCEK